MAGHRGPPPQRIAAVQRPFYDGGTKQAQHQESDDYWRPGEWRGQDLGSADNAMVAMTPDVDTRLGALAAGSLPVR